MFVGCARVGLGPLGLQALTEIEVRTEALRAFWATNATSNERPPAETSGVHRNVPEVFAASGVNVAPPGSAPSPNIWSARRLEIASPSGSTAETLKVINEPTAPVTV